MRSHAARSAGSGGRNTWPTANRRFGGQLEAEPRALGAEEPLGQLHQDAGAVAGLRIGAARRAMREPAQDLEALVDDGARPLALDVRDEADAAGVSFPCRISMTQ